METHKQIAYAALPKMVTSEIFSGSITKVGYI